MIEPLQQRWALCEGREPPALAEAAEVAKGRAHAKLRNELQEKVVGWMEELSAVRILDPACGSGNFLYLALRRMLDLWHEARLFAAAHGLPTFIEKQVHPQQLFGLETNIYAQELASVVVWIGYLQWLNEHGIGWPVEPILRKLDNIQHRDAILRTMRRASRWNQNGRKRISSSAIRRFLGTRKCAPSLAMNMWTSLRALYADACRAEPTS